MKNIIYYNRHIVVTGATGSGKTTTLMGLIEDLRAQNIDVVVVDIKGDVSAVQRLEGAVVIDPFKGMVSLNDIDPIIMSILFKLNDPQTASLYTMFKEQDNIHDWEDLEAALEVYSDPGSYPSLDVSYLNQSSLNVIKRNMMFLEDARSIFASGQQDLFPLTIIDATKLQHYPEAYATLMLHMIDKLYRESPEVGDVNKQVILIDEAHLLFTGMNKRLEQLMDRRIRLIRSKGIGLVFATQSAADLPENIRAQIGTQIFHQARTYTARETRNVKTAVEGLRGDHKELFIQIQQLAIGEALFSTLTKEGTPTTARVIKIDLPKFNLSPTEYYHLPGRTVKVPKLKKTNIFDRILERRPHNE